MNKSKESGKFFATIQQVGKSFFLPVSVLPIAGLLLGLGSSFTNQTTIKTYNLTGLLGSGTVLNGLLTIMSQVGTAIFVFIDFWVPLGTLFLFSYFTWFSGYRVSQTGKTYPYPVLHHADNEVWYLPDCVPSFYLSEQGFLHYKQ